MYENQSDTKYVVFLKISGRVLAVALHLQYEKGCSCILAIHARDHHQHLVLLE